MGLQLAGSLINHHQFAGKRVIFDPMTNRGNLKVSLKFEHLSKIRSFAAKHQFFERLCYFLVDKMSLKFELPNHSLFISQGEAEFESSGRNQPIIHPVADPSEQQRGGPDLRAVNFQIVQYVCVNCVHENSSSVAIGITYSSSFPFLLSPGNFPPAI